MVGSGQRHHVACIGRCKRILARLFAESQSLASTVGAALTEAFEVALSIQQGGQKLHRFNPFICIDLEACALCRGGSQCAAVLCPPSQGLLPPFTAAMNVNVDAAHQCLDKAKAALRSGDVGKATRLLERSLRLHESTEARSLLASLQAKAQRAQRPAPSTPNSGGGTSTPASAASSGKGTPTADAATTQRILRAQDLYDVLGISRTASSAQVKKAYRKVRLVRSFGRRCPRGLSYWIEHTMNDLAPCSSH